VKKKKYRGLEYKLKKQLVGAFSLNTMAFKEFKEQKARWLIWRLLKGD